MVKEKLKYLVGILAVSTMLVGSFCIFGNSASADTSSGDDGGITGGGCGHIGQDWWADVCYGATWRVYEADSDYIEIPDSPGGNTHGGVITGCKSNGGYYWRLALQAYKPGVGPIWDPMPEKGPKFLPHVGLIPVKYVQGLWDGGLGLKNVRFRYFDGHTKRWEEAKSAYESAVDNGLTWQHEWSEVSWFCWNGDDKSEFSSNSGVQVVSADKEAYSGPDGEANITVKTSSRETVVGFWHHLRYSSNASADNYPDVETNWTVSGNVTGSNNNELITNGNFRTPGGKNGNGTQSGTLANTQPVTVVLDRVGDSQTVCRTIQYNHKNVEFKKNGNTGIGAPQYSGEGSSKACATIIRTGDGTDPGNKAYNAEFYSTSTVGINDITYSDNSNIIDVHAQSSTTAPDSSPINNYQTPDNATTGNRYEVNADKGGRIAFTVDYMRSEVDINFHHDLYYKVTKNPTPDPDYPNLSFSAKDIVEKAFTNWSVRTTGAKVVSAPTGAGTFTVKDSKNSDHVTVTSNPGTVTVKLDPGQTTTVCQTIIYSPKYVSFESIRDHDSDSYRWRNPTHNDIHEYYEYALNNSFGAGTSTACADITRSNFPDGYPSSHGGTENRNLYAGEKVEDIAWNNLAASGSMTRRLTAFAANVFLVPANQALPANLANGGRKFISTTSSTYPCTYYANSPFSISQNWCSDVSSGVSLSMSRGSFSKRIAAVSPDLVGYKLCNTAGWFWEKWVRVCETSDGKTTCWWEHRPEGDHWYVYGAACRTIAKKPTTAFWNSGLFTNGGITTSSASRYGGNGPQFATNDFVHSGAIPSTSTLFGSWSEYLTVANGEINKNFASGSAISRGNQPDTNTAALTISNNNELFRGNANVKPTSTLRTRLAQYLSNPPGSPDTNISNIGATTVSETKIYTSNGLTISDNIVTDGSKTSNIYELPKMIIFVNGDVNIASNVKQVDAWIIATGSINTCSSFEQGNTHTVTAVNPNDPTAVCESQLALNGPVMAGGVRLNRTHGSDPATGTARYTPAEIFNLSADDYLWAYAQSSRYASAYTEAYSRELAPRY